jgi:hypothetical protein
VTGQPIVAPTDLQAIKPDIVVIMNAIYESEIRELLAGMELAPEIYCL